MGGRQGGGIEQKGKRTREHGQQCGGCWGQESLRGLNSNGKNIIQFFFKLALKCLIVF